MTNKSIYRAYNGNSRHFKICWRKMRISVADEQNALCIIYGVKLLFVKMMNRISTILQQYYICALIVNDFQT